MARLRRTDSTEGNTAISTLYILFKVSNFTFYEYSVVDSVDVILTSLTQLMWKNKTFERK